MEFDRLSDVERELLRAAPRPDFEFLHEVEALLRPAPASPAPRRRSRHSRTTLAIGLAAALTVAIVAGLATTGGLSYAASSVDRVVKLVHRASKPQTAIVIRGLSAGGDQYRPGFGFGDENHNHTGPPGLSRTDESGAPVNSDAPVPARPAPGGLARAVTAAVNFDEQAHLWISVIDRRGTPLLLTQQSKRGGSSVGGKLTGPQTKFIQYALLVPRTVQLQLRVPENLLRRGTIYRIRIVAVDPQGNKSRIFIPFRQS